MAEKIITKTMKRGDRCESKWPSEFGEGKRGWFIQRGDDLLELDTTPVQAEPVAPYVIGDRMKATEHPAIMGKMVDSKSEFKKITKASGFECRTGAPKVADNIPKLKETTEDHYIRDVKIAREQVMAGTAPLTDYDKHVCKQINERIKNKV